MLIQFKFLMNEFPVTDTSRKIKQIITNRQKEGKWVCAVPYGYRITNTKEMTYEIDPPAAEIVREIFRLYNNGWGYKKIANHLTDQESPPLVPTRSPKRKRWGRPLSAPPARPGAWPRSRDPLQRLLYWYSPAEEISPYQHQRHG